MGGNNSQTTNTTQSQNSSFNQLSNMIENLATQGSSNYFSNQQQQGNTAGTTASNVNPWAPAVPSLTNLIGSISGQGYGLTPQQQAALASMNTAAGTLPGFGAPATGSVNNLFTSTNGVPQAGMLGDAYQTYQNTVAPFLNPNYLDPNSNPVLSRAIFDPVSGLNKQIATGISSEFAGAGRDPAGNADASKAIAAGESQVDLPLLLNQYNTNVGTQLGANAGQLGAAGSTASGQTSLLQTPLMNQIAAIQAAGNVPGLWMGPSQAKLGAANTAFGAPFSNISIPQQMLAQLAGLGGTTTGATTGQQFGTQAGTGGQQQQQTSQGTSNATSSGTQQGTMTGTSTTTQPINPWTTAAGLGLGLFALSDERVKENIEPVGLLANGLNVYKYNFRGDSRPQIGLLAQEVEKVKPEAVIDLPIGRSSVKLVNYDAATRPANDAGLWRQAA